eukprot:SAG11_NODE_7137_length_1188_cov_2.129477_2_plen_190_part_00
MDARQRYLFDTHGYIVISGCIGYEQLHELNKLFSAAELDHPPLTSGHGRGQGPSGDPLHYGKAFRDLLDHPKVSPVLDELFGCRGATSPSFRIDHVNCHNWCRPDFWQANPQYAADICTLHGGGSTDGKPDLPPTNARSDNNQFFVVERTNSTEGHGRGRQFHNGLVSATFELMDTRANGGGFCCVPGR